MEPKITVIVVDDDPVQLEIICDYVRKTNFLTLEGSFTDPILALEAIVNERPNLLLADVEMPKLTGFELLETIKDPPKTIIITGEEKYAAEAFAVDVIDYLVKPVDSYPRFLKAVNKVKSTPIAKSTLGDNDSIFIKENALLVKLSLKDITYFEAFGDYVKVGTKDKVHVVHSTLTKVESKLDDKFVRVHRSFVVRLSAIANIDQTNIQVGDKIIPVSKSLKSDLMERINTL